MSSIDVPKIIGLFEERAASAVGTHSIPSTSEAPLLSVPPGRAIIDTLEHAKARADWEEEQAPHPRARKGNALLGTLSSFIAWIARFKRPESVVYASADQIVAISDYHGPTVGGEPGHMRHRAVHEWPFDEAWRFWSSVANRTLTHADLAVLIEERIGDIVEESAIDVKGAGDLARQLGLSLGGPSAMLATARGIELYSSARVSSVQNTATGEVRIAYEEAAKEGGAQTIPTAFLISIPVFDGGAPYVVTVRLSRKLKDGAITWHVRPQRLRDVERVAREDALDRVRREGGVPVLEGHPEQL